MARLTIISDNGYVIDKNTLQQTDKGYTGDAIEKLARFENLIEDLLNSQRQIPIELEMLRNEGKTKSVRFRELMVKKITNANLLDLFKIYSL